jgi:hypothetical protein
MFSDHLSEATEFPSNWRQTRSVKEGGCQTDDQKMVDVGAQSRYYDDVGMQTEPVNRLIKVAAKTRMEHLFLQEEAPRLDADAQGLQPSLIKFLSRAAPLIEYELSAASRSRAFDGYSLIDDDEEKEVRKLHTLVDGVEKKNADGDEAGMRVSAVTWSSSGAYEK